MTKKSISESVTSTNSQTSETEMTKTRTRYSEIFQQNLDKSLDLLKKLPPNELSYYISLLIGSIETETNPEEHGLLLASTLNLTTALSDFYSATKENKIPDSEAILLALNDLVSASKLNTVSHKIKKALMGICAAVLTVFIGISAGIGGLIVGLFTDYTVIGNLRGAYLGFVMGLGVGIHIGTNLPAKMFQSDFESKLEFTINSIQKVADELQDRKTPEQYRQETKQYVMDTFFKNLPEGDREEAFNNFLTKNQKFEVCSTAAGFIDAHLKGHLGQHSLIRYSIEGLEERQTMEFNPSEKAPNFLNQYEDEREVSGEKFFDMLVLNRILQETHEFSLGFILGTYSVGSNDCLTYVNKILLGTGQPPTEMQRFNPEVDKWTSTNVVGPIMGFFSKTRGDELKPFARHFEDNNHPDIHFQKWTGKKAKPTDDANFPVEPESGMVY